MIDLALLVLVVGGIVAVVTVARDRSDAPFGGADDGGHGTLRHVFVYALALLGAVLTAAGVSGLARTVLSGFDGDLLVGEPGRTAALGLALTVVGLPLWLATWRVAGRDARESEAERASLARRLYLAAVRAVALTVGTVFLVETGHWLVGAHEYDAGALARALVWLALWAHHERVAGEVAFGSPRTRFVDRAEVYLAATGGFALLAVSAAVVLAGALGELYDLGADTELLVVGGADRAGLREPAVGAVVGAALWWWHWQHVGRRDAGSTGWLTYLFLVGVLSGTVTTVAAGSVALHAVLAWLLGGADQPLAQHFDVLPAAVAALVVGVAVWGYHRAVLIEVEPAERADWTTPQRVYRYLVTGAGMLTTAAGVAIVLIAGLDVAVGAPSLVDRSERVTNLVAVGVTLLVLGGPLWAWAWSRVQRHVAARPAERGALARRVLIFGAFGAAIVTAVVALGVLLFEVFDGAFAGELSTGIVEQQRWSLALLLTAAAVSVHYGLVLREDRELTPERGAARAGPPSRIVLVAAGSDALATAVRARVAGLAVSAWERADGDGAPPDEDALAATADAIAQQLAATTGTRALVLVEPGGDVRVVRLRAT